MNEDQAVNQKQTPISPINAKTAAITGRIVEMPEALAADLVTMRRNPAEFTVTDRAKCKLCYKRNSFDLAHAMNSVAGTWCSVHGWLHFDSVRIRPIGEEIPQKKRKAQ